MADMLQTIITNKRLLITTIIYMIILFGLFVYLLYLQNKHKTFVGIHKLSGINGDLGVENSRTY